MAGTDLGMVRASMSGALRAMPGVMKSAVRVVRRLRKKGEESELPESNELDAQSDRLAAAFYTPEIRAVLARFDQRFDESLAVLGQRG
jgi:hypothetical protein